MKKIQFQKEHGRTSELPNFGSATIKTSVPVQTELLKASNEGPLNVRTQETYLMPMHSSQNSNNSIRNVIRSFAEKKKRKRNISLCEKGKSSPTFGTRFSPVELFLGFLWATGSFPRRRSSRPPRTGWEPESLTGTSAPESDEDEVK